MEMERKFLIRYIILMILLIILASAAWYMSRQTGTPVDAVLAKGKEYKEVSPWQIHCI